MALAFALKRKCRYWSNAYMLKRKTAVDEMMKSTFMNYRNKFTYFSFVSAPFF
jgi:hypothetical protein